MSYTFTELTAAEFEGFIRVFRETPVFQTPAWAKVKSGWQNAYFGVKDENGALCGATMMLIRRIVPAFAFGYCPRGPLLDWNDKEALACMTEGLRKYAKKHGVCYVKIDPQIPRSVTLPQPDCYNPFAGKEEEYAAAHETIQSLDYRHKGFFPQLRSTIQPRFNTMIALKDRNGTPLTPEQLLKSYRPKGRRYLGAFPIARGVSATVHPATEESVETFARLIRATEARQNIHLRGESYFTQMANAFGENAKIVLTKCHVETYEQTLKKRLAAEPENAEKLQKQLDEAAQIRAERGDDVTLAGSLIVYPPNETGLKIAEDLYGGADLSVFSSFRITMNGLHGMACYCAEQGYDLLNLGGVEGTLDDGLYEFKSQFAPIVVEFYGEYDLIVSPLRYKILEKYLPAALRLYKKILRRQKKEV